MADTYEKDLAQKSSLTVNDFIRVVGTDNVSYKQLVSDVAKKIIENYTGSSLAGSSQSVKSALDALNSNTALTITIDESKIRNPESVKAYRIGKIVVLSFWGTEFSAAGYISGIVSGLPRPQAPASTFVAFGSTNAYNIQGNIYISSGTSANAGLKTDYPIGTAVYGSLVYLST